jgi:hypothetical protein
VGSRIATALIAVVLVGCDAFYAATIRNDLDQDVTVKFAFDSSDLVDEGAGPLHPGRFASVSKVGGPGERPTLLLKAFDMQGNLVFCRRLEYEAYRKSSRDAPLSIRPGQLTCN